MLKRIMLGLVCILALTWLALVIYGTVEYTRQRNPEAINFDAALVQVKAGNVRQIVEQTNVVILVLHDNTYQQFAKPTTHDFLYIILLESGVPQSQLDQISFVTGDYFRIQYVVGMYITSYVFIISLWLLMLLFTSIHLWRRDLVLSLKLVYFVGIVAIPVLGLLVYWSTAHLDRSTPRLST
jgi:predicted cobalt transporter CbtA